MKTPNPSPFPGRKLISNLLRLLGWGLTVGGPGNFVIWLIHNRPQHNVDALHELAPWVALVALVVGVCLLAFDLLIAVAVAIEANTNRMPDGAASVQGKQP